MMAPILCFPEGLFSDKVMSGTPEILDVNAMLPFAKAANGLPEGASVTDKVSMMSAYISLDVCRTLDLRHGNAGVCAELSDDMAVAGRFGLDELVLLHISQERAMYLRLCLTLAS
jgi:hypothetical protein